MSFRDVKIKISDRNWDQGDFGDVTHRKRGLRFEKSSELSSCLRTRESRFRAG